MRRIAPLVVLAGLVLAPGCKKKTDEDRIREVFADISESAADGDINGVLIHVADDYVGPRNTDKKMVKQLLIREMLQGRRIRIKRRHMKIEVAEGHTTATATFDALLTRASTKQGVLPQDVGTWRFDASLEKRDGQWLITKGDYQPISSKDFLAP